MEDPLHDEEWMLVGGCQGCSLLPRSQYRGYLLGQGMMMLVAVVSSPILIMLLSG